MAATMDAETALLPTELEIVAPFDLSPFVQHFGARVLILRDSMEDGLRTLWLDLVPARKTLDDAVAQWIAMVEEMPASLRTLWSSCTDRCLNTGIQSGRRPHATYLDIRETTVAGAARISVRLNFSVYALD